MLRLIDCNILPENIVFNNSINIQPGKLVYLVYQDGKILLKPADGFNIYGILAFNMEPWNSRHCF